MMWQCQPCNYVLVTSLGIRDSWEEIRTRIRVGEERVARFALCCTVTRGSEQLVGNFVIY
jgi:hypothetical protein